MLKHLKSTKIIGVYIFVILLITSTISCIFNIYKVIELKKYEVKNDDKDYENAFEEI